MRSPLALVVVSVVSVVSSGAASGAYVGHAHAANPAAEMQNDRGKALYKERRFEEAVAAFRQATSVDADPRYAFNRCVALEKLARWDEALAACDEVFAGSATEALRAKAGERSAALRRARAAAADHAPAPASPPGPPGSPAATPPGQPAVFDQGGSGPSPEIPTQARDYRWALGVTVGPGYRGGLGNEGLRERGSFFDVHLDAYVLPSWRLGVRALLGVSSFVTGGDASDLKLQVTDVGAGAYLHVPVGRVVLTPLAALQVGVIQPDSVAFTGEPYGVASLRLGVTADLVRGHHVFSLGPSFTAYLPAATESMDPALQPEVYGLDTGGVTFAIVFGYTYRFMTIGIPGVIALE